MQQAGEANAQEGPAASAAGEEAALRSPRGSNSNADAVLQTAGSAEDPAQPTIMQPLEPGSTADVMEVIAQELLNPRADNHVRKAANMCLQVRMHASFRLQAESSTAVVTTKAESSLPLPRQTAGISCAFFPGSRLAGKANEIFIFLVVLC